VVDEIVRSWFLICVVSSSECYLKMQNDFPMIIEETEILVLRSLIGRYSCG
jgi:hypothetical protein